MATTYMIDSEIAATFSEMQYIIRMIYSARELQVRNYALNQLWTKMARLEFLTHLIQIERKKALQQLPRPNSTHPFQQFNIPAIPVQGSSVGSIGRQTPAVQPGYSANPQLLTQQAYPTVPLNSIQPVYPNTQTPSSQPANPVTQNPGNPNGQTFTREQLAQFTGLNGMPAYVAVNGIVYDVTNNAAWSAATHFGLRAGRELTAEFASCHAGQQWILAQLKAIGRLAG